MSGENTTIHVRATHFSVHEFARTFWTLPKFEHTILRQFHWSSGNTSRRIREHNYCIQTCQNFDHERSRNDTISFFHLLLPTIFSASNTTDVEKLITQALACIFARTHAPPIDDLLHTPPEISRFYGTTVLTNDHLPSPPCWRHLTAVSSPHDDRPPRGASTGRLPGSSVASNLFRPHDRITSKYHEHISRLSFFFLYFSQYLAVQYV